MNLKEIRIELIKIEKSITWLASRLGYSTTYLYEVIKSQKSDEIKRIVDILEKENR